MKIKILAVLFFAFYMFGFAQRDRSNCPNFIGENLNGIKKNPNWKILAQSTGDLNKDGLDDVAIILESKDSIQFKKCFNCKLIKSKPRVILVLFNQDSKQTVVIQNNKFIARGDEGGMVNYLEPELSIKNGWLKIFYQYTRSHQSYTFEFRNNQMELILAESVGVHSARGDFESDKFDFIKGILTSETGNISQEKSKKEIFRLDIQPKSLNEFGEMYEWEVFENKYL